MKNSITFIFLCLFFKTLGQIGINTTFPKGALDIESINTGVLIPRVQLTSTLDNTTVINPVGGALSTSTLIYNIAPAGVVPNNVLIGFYFWNNSTSKWIPIQGNSNWEKNGNNTISTPSTPLVYGTSVIGATENFLGTTDFNDLTLGTNNIERVRVKNITGNIGVGTANPSTTLEITSAGTTELRLSSRGFFGPTRFSMISDKELINEWRPTFIESADSGSFTGRMDFFTNGTGIANKFGSVRAMSITNSKVGIGIINPTEKLHVFQNTDSNKSVIYSEARQISTGTDYDNIAIKGYGRAMPSWGYGNGVMGIGDVANSYFATGVYAHLGSTTPVFPNTNQALFANGNNLGNAAIFAGGNVGIGTTIGTNPSNLLHINSASSGALRIVDGTEGNKKVLTSNATGVATWQSVGIENIQADLSAVAGVNIPYTQTANYLQTGASITLPPGRYSVNVTMLLSTVPGVYVNSNEAFWVRSSFSDSSGINPLPTLDIIGSNLVSGNQIPSTLYSLITGVVIINNTTAANKTYYYVAGRVVTNNSTRTLANFGGNYWAENNIIAYKLN
jgi:hypothetical protein